MCAPRQRRAFKLISYCFSWPLGRLTNYFVQPYFVASRLAYLAGGRFIYLFGQVQVKACVFFPFDANVRLPQLAGERLSKVARLCEQVI